LGLSIFFVIDLSKSKREKRPISKLLKGMALSTAGVFAVVLCVVIVIFVVNWYQSSFISACKGLPSVQVNPNVKNGSLAAAVKLTEPEGLPQQYAILSVSPNGKLLNKLSSQPNSKDPAWSPDGQRVVYAAQPSPTQPWGLYLSDAQGQPLGTLVENPLEMRSPSWKPDGSTLLFQRWLEQSNHPNLEIFTLNLKGGNVLPISNNQATDSSARYSPDGRQIVFYSERDSASEIYVMDSDGKHGRRLTHNSDHDGDPAWSPDGKWIVFTSNRGSPLGWSNNHLYIMAADGTHQCQLTHGKGFEGHAVWSPNGEWIAYVNLMDTVIHLVHPDGSGETTLPFPQKIKELLSLDWAVGAPQFTRRE
jgi:Tol biopolymer transport system component